MTTQRTDDTAQLPWAQTETIPYAAQSASSPAAPPDAAATDLQPTTAPALNPPTWSGRKTAIAAALAIGISSMGAVAAAAALPAGTSPAGSQFQQGGFGPGGQRPGPGTRQQGGLGQQGGVPQQAPVDPSAGTT